MTSATHRRDYADRLFREWDLPKDELGGGR